MRPSSLAQQVAASGFRPDIVLAIARGGLTVAGALAYALSVKNCFAMNVEFYTGVDERLDVPVMLPPDPRRGRHHRPAGPGRRRRGRHRSRPWRWCTT